MNEKKKKSYFMEHLEIGSSMFSPPCFCLPIFSFPVLCYPLSVSSRLISLTACAQCSRSHQVPHVFIWRLFLLPLPCPRQIACVCFVLGELRRSLLQIRLVHLHYFPLNTVYGAWLCVYYAPGVLSFLSKGRVGMCFESVLSEQ